VLKILLDQNLPYKVVEWLAAERPTWEIHHVKDLGFEGKADDFLYRWAQETKSIIITYDEDFADSRMYPLGDHHGIVRLRVWPTTLEKTCSAIARLLQTSEEKEWRGSLIIIDNQKIRIRRR